MRDWFFETEVSGFTNGLAPDALDAQIRALRIDSYEGLGTRDGTLRLTFGGDLTSGERQLVFTVIKDHDGIPTPDPEDVVTIEPFEIGILGDSSNEVVNLHDKDNPIPWNTVSVIGPLKPAVREDPSSFIRVNQTAPYLVCGAVCVRSGIANSRWSGALKFRINGQGCAPPRFLSAQGQVSASFPFNVVLRLNAGDYFEALVDIDNTVDGTIHMIPRYSSMHVVALVK